MHKLIIVAILLILISAIWPLPKIEVIPVLENQYMVNVPGVEYE